MADEIQVYPQGLVDLLNIKQGARRSVDKLLQDVRPTLDLMDIFSAQSIEHTGVTSAAMVTGTTLSIDVPALQTWFVYAVTAAVTMPLATDVVDVGLGLVHGGGTEINLARSGLETAQINNETVFLPLQFTRPLVLKPGDTLRNTVRHFAGPSPSVIGTLRVRIARVGPTSKESFL